MSKNSLNDGSPGFEPNKGKKTVNIITRKVARLANQDGDIQEFIIEEKVSRPSDDGTYIDSEIQTMHVDRAGNPLPEDLRTAFVSHSHLLTPEKYKDNCTSWLHFNGSKIIYIGQDGHKTNGGAICSRCESRLHFIYLIAGILCLGVVFGLYKGVGLF